MGQQAKDMNFYQRWKEVPRTREGGYTLGAALPFVAVAVVGTVVSVMLLAGNYRLTKELDQTRAWLEAAETVSALQNMEAKEAENAQVLAALQGVEAGKAAAKSYPVVNSAVTNAISAAGGAKITMRLESYDAQSGVLSFSAHSPVVIDIPDYIRRLQGTGLFRTVDYSGYGFDTNKGVYSIHVVCSLKAETGKGAQP